MQNWLFDSGGCAVIHDFERRERIDFASGAMTAFMEETPVMNGVSLYRVDARGRGSFRMSKEPPQQGGRVILGCLMGGRGRLEMDGCDAHDWRDGGRAFSLTPIDRAVSYDVSAEREWSCVALRLEETALDLLARDTVMPAVAKSALQGRTRDHAQAKPLSSALRQTMQELLRPTYSGTMTGLYRQSKALEFLAHQFDVLSGDTSCEDVPRGRELTRLREARDRLLQDLREPPCLEDLAASVNMTPRRLNAGFRAVFGTTVFDYLRDARMDAARGMLEDGLRMPLKQLAWSIGYGQTTNFVTAFRRRFGVSPGRYRRAVLDND